MREIKFRAYSTILDGSPYMYSWHELSTGSTDQLRSSENWKVMQYTGLKDKKGVEAYLDDIVDAQLIDSNGYSLGKHRGVIRFGEFELELHMEDDFFPVASWVLVSSFEILGNLYENPELMEGE